MPETGMAAATIGVVAIGAATTTAVAPASGSVLLVARLPERRSPRRPTRTITRTATATRTRPTGITPTDRTTRTEPGLTPVFRSGRPQRRPFLFGAWRSCKSLLKEHIRNNWKGAP